MEPPIPHQHETYYLLYSDDIHEIVMKIVRNIASTYSTFRYLEHTPDIEKDINRQFHEIKLTKRTIVFAILVPNNPEVVPPGSQKIRLSATIKPKEIYVGSGKQSEIEYAKVELIKAFQLDSVWIGLLYRIGTDVEEFQDYLTTSEHFQVWQTSAIRHFLQSVERYIQTQPLDSILLAKGAIDVMQKQTDYNSRVEEVIRSKFNQRVVIADITCHEYLHLLTSRSYFHLIYIEGQIINRYQNFKKQIVNSYPRLLERLTLDNFILLDDYIYSNFIFECLGKVKKFINRTVQQEPYSQIVRKYHRDIIRVFRPNIDEYFLNICLVLRERAACLKEAVGSIIVNDRSIISTGYNGTPRGTVNCYNGGCLVCNNSEKMGTEVLSCRCIHAEYNCILTAGITATRGGTLYSTKLPCLWCAKLIIQGGISKVIFLRSYYSSLQYENVELVKKTFAKGNVLLLPVDMPSRN